jgi:pullulanase/glycogen debranching enzyme
MRVKRGERKRRRDREDVILTLSFLPGFTLLDLVSYDNKHNEANKEGNRDGADNNMSWNHGHEGQTDNPEIVEFR